MILVPKLSEALTPHQFEDFAKRYGVQARGSGGEHTPAGPGGKWDVSNYQRIGFTEVELVQKMINGCEALISAEQKLEGGAGIAEAMGDHADLLEEKSNFPVWKPGSKCLVRKFVSPENWERLSKLKTSKGFDLA